jgi:hypothetical protein
MLEVYRAIVQAARDLGIRVFQMAIDTNAKDEKKSVRNYMKLAGKAESNEERDSFVRLAVLLAKEDEAAREKR